MWRFWFAVHLNLKVCHSISVFPATKNMMQADCSLRLGRWPTRCIYRVYCVNPEGHLLDPWEKESNCPAKKKELTSLQSADKDNVQAPAKRYNLLLPSSQLQQVLAFYRKCLSRHISRLHSPHTLTSFRRYGRWSCQVFYLLQLLLTLSKIENRSRCRSMSSTAYVIGFLWPPSSDPGRCAKTCWSLMRIG
jgi:hypothetical protein